MITSSNRLWSVANSVLELSAGIFTIGFITRFYATDVAGVWFVFMAIFGITSALRDAMIQSALVKHATSRALSRFRYLHANFLAMLVFEAAVAFCVVLSSFFVEGMLTTLLLCYPLYSLSNALYRWQVFYLRSQFRIRLIAYSTAASVAGAIVMASIVYYFSMPLMFVEVGLAIVSCFACLVGMAAVPYKLMFRRRVAKAHFSTIRTYGGFAMLRELNSAVSSRISIFYAASFLTLQQTALLGVAQRFSQLALLPNNASQSLLFPFLVSSVNEGRLDRAREAVEQSIAGLLAATIPMASTGIFLLPWLLNVIYGPAYSDAWPMVAIYLLLSTMLTPFGTAFGSMVTALGKPHLAFRVVFVNSMINIALTYFAMREIGVFGVPLALALTEIAGFVWISVVMKRMCQISFIRCYARLPETYLRLTFKIIKTFRTGRLASFSK